MLSSVKAGAFCSWMTVFRSSSAMNYTPTEVGGFWEHHRRMIEHLTNRQSSMSILL